MSEEVLGRGKMWLAVVGYFSGGAVANKERRSVFRKHAWVGSKKLCFENSSHRSPNRVRCMAPPGCCSRPCPDEEGTESSASSAARLACAVVADLVPMKRELKEYSFISVISSSCSSRPCPDEEGTGSVLLSGRQRTLYGSRPCPDQEGVIVPEGPSLTH